MPEIHMDPDPYYPDDVLLERALANGTVEKLIATLDNEDLTQIWLNTSTEGVLLVERDFHRLLVMGLEALRENEQPKVTEAMVDAGERALLWANANEPRTDKPLRDKVKLVLAAAFRTMQGSAQA
ncbi:hypothetical protein RGI145_12440 [Roseomonas gilardii]|uniref:Uncharacterized protein n=1 Tax=Roseomonas gilardii TaxID=257708 RepID=A0A1L7AGD8_9PROT|nr:hypothetical protein [Roseomonas gilardii]APT57801.1 hypothetical protein RGI145_12440 [Roseomonas gilardii]